MRPFILLASVLLLAGCQSTDSAQNLQAAVAADQARVREMNNECRRQFTTQQQAVLLAKCMNNAMATALYIKHRDLADLYMSKRLIAAEQYRDGKISLSQLNLKEAEYRSEMAAEEQRRNLAEQSVAAQSRPIMIMHTQMPRF